MEKNNSKKLNAQDINVLLQEVEFKNLPTISIFGQNVNMDSLYTSIFSIVLWIIIWCVFGLFNIPQLGNYSLIFFFGLIAVVIFNIFNSSLDIEISVEMALERLHDEIIRIEGLLGAIIIVFVFLFNIQMNQEAKFIAYKILVILLILICISLVKYDSRNDTRNIRAIRLFVQKFYNQAIILFMMVLCLIFVGVKTQ